MIEEPVTAEDFLSGLGVDTIIESDKEPAICKRVWDSLSGRVPESVPRDFGRSHEGVESSLGDMGKTKDGVEASKKIGSFRRGEWDDDGQERVGEPSTAFFAFFGLGKIIFKLFEELI